MSKLVWRPVTPNGADYVVEHLRTSDQEEAMASHHVDAYRAVYDSLDAATISRAIWTEDGEPVGLCGVSTREILGGGSLIWLLGTSELTATAGRRRQLVVEGRAWVEQLLAEGRGPLLNWVHANNHCSIKWLAALGFRLDVPEPYGYSRQLFRYFVRTK